MTFGEQIKQARERKNISQEELAEYIGVSRQAVSKWENDSSLPHGANREKLTDFLNMELIGEEPLRKNNNIAWIGWLIAGVLLLLVIGLWVYHSVKISNVERQAEMMPTSINCVIFYDSEQKEIVPDSQGYNANDMASVLVQWKGDISGSVDMFFVDVAGQKDLLFTKEISVEDTAVLFNADVFKEKEKGQIYFEINYENEKIVSHTYDVFLETSILAYIESIDDQVVLIDQVEWVVTPSDRATELGITSKPSGFEIYNEKVAVEEFDISDDCICRIFDWEQSNIEQEVSISKFDEILKKEIPYNLKVKGNQIVEISEQYVP